MESRRHDNEHRPADTLYAALGKASFAAEAQQHQRQRFIVTNIPLGNYLIYLQLTSYIYVTVRKVRTISCRTYS
jgi:hypothetical protein